MVDHLEEEKKMKMAEALALSPKNKDQNIMLKTQVFFDGTEQFISVILLKLFIFKTIKNIKIINSKLILSKTSSKTLITYQINH